MPEQVTDEQKQDERRADEAVISEAMDRFKLCEEAEHDIRAAALDDLEFLAGDQWPIYAKRERERDRRPMLVVNRLDQFVQHITNAQRQNRVSSKVIPVDDRADIDTAEVRQGLIRHIEYNSRADYAYDTAEFYAVAMGWGGWRLDRRYCHPRTHDQDIIIRRIRNPFQMYLDPSHEEPDGLDSEFGFLMADFTKQEYQRTFPDSDLASARDWQSLGDHPADWLKDDGVRVVEYFYKKYRRDKVLLLRGPGGMMEMLASEIPQELTRGWSVARERETQIPTINICKLNAVEVLEKSTWPGQHINLVKVTGHELDLNGRLILKGIVRNLKDAQRQYNFMLSAQTEAIDASKGQVVVSEGQLENHEAEWAELSKRKLLVYKDTSVEGKPAPQPTRLPANVSIPAMTEARLLAAEDLKALTGVYDAALGARSNEQSGKAIISRQQQTDTANFHFPDNLTRSIGHSARMINDAMPSVYDGARVVRIIGEDDSHKVVKINQEFDEGGEKRNYDFSVGKYDVIATAGPSFQSRRQEGAQLLIQLAQTPAGAALMTAAPDLVMKTLDIPYAQEISDRLKKTLPPNLQDQEEDGAEKVPPQVQQRLAALMQQHEVLTQALNAATQKLETDGVKAESQERIEAAKRLLEQRKLDIEERKLDIELAKIESNEAIKALELKIETLMAQMQVNVDAEAREADRAAEAISSES